ncbi:hypothetical protein V8G54_029469, partial [Vigna mungo]
TVCYSFSINQQNKIRSFQCHIIINSQSSNKIKSSKMNKLFPISESPSRTQMELGFSHSSIKSFKKENHMLRKMIKKIESAFPKQHEMQLCAPLLKLTAQLLLLRNKCQLVCI